MTYPEGTILYFSPFIFPDGGAPKPKYFLVLRQSGTHLVLASLPTSKDSVPSQISRQHGCIDLPTINFNCYCFLAGQEVASHPFTGMPFAFPRDTFVYGFRINLFNTAVFDRQVEEHQTKIEVMGCLHPDEYRNLIACLKHSSSVKRRFRQML